MGLISYMLFSKEYFKDNIENFKEQFTINTNLNNINNEYINKTNFTTGAFISILLITILNILPAMIISLHCAAKQTDFTKYLHPIIAFFFSDVYLLVFVIRKFILKDSSFCTNILVKN